MPMHLRLIFFLILLLSTITLSADNTYKRPATILAAGNLKFVFPQIIQKFYQKYPNASIHIQYGASGNLTESIMQGKEYDIFFSADTTYPKMIYKNGKSATKPQKYAQGLLILFVPSNPSLADKKLKILADTKINAITVANSANAPYGVAAMEVIKNSQCCQNTRNKIHYSSDVATAIDNVIWQGNAGFLSKSALFMIPDNRKKEGVDWIDIDTKLYAPIIQAYVISKEGLKNDNAQKFLHFIESKEGQKIFRDNGYKNIKPE